MSSDLTSEIVKDWTIMVYMAGDNNLSQNMAFSLNDIRTVAQEMRIPAQDKVNMLAFFDSNSMTAPTHYIDYSILDTLSLFYLN